MIARTLAIVTAAILISSCSILGTKKVEVVSKPVQLDIIQPTLPRPLELDVPKWYVVSEAIITNPCKKVLDEETGKEKRPKQCDLEEREKLLTTSYTERFGAMETAMTQFNSTKTLLENFVEAWKKQK